MDSKVFIIMLFFVGHNFGMIGVTSEPDLWISSFEEHLQVKNQHSSSFADAEIISVNQEMLTKSAGFEIKDLHKSISIRSDGDFASLGLPGSGSVYDPYLIEGFDITDSGSSLISIRDTTAYFRISHNKLKGLSTSFHGIEISNATHGTISRNVISQNYLFGILIRNASDIEISNNFVANNNQGGINVYLSQGIVISSNAIHYNNGTGIWFRDHVKSSHIFDNTLMKNKGFGVLLGRDHPDESYTSNNNEVFQNNFIGNSPKTCTQAGDYGGHNNFSSNYWDDWVEPDQNSDGQVDNPYPICPNKSGVLFNQRTDVFPSINPYSPHLILPLLLLYPGEDNNPEKVINIEWTAPSDSSISSMTYSVYISSDNITWEQKESNLEMTNYLWDTTTEPAGEYLIKIVAVSIYGLSVETISDHKITISRQSRNHNNVLELFIQFFIIVGLLGILAVSGIILYKRKYKKTLVLTELFPVNQPDILRSTYHKIVIGFENAKLERTEDPVILESVDTTDYAALVNIFPSELRNELKTDIRGKSVLILIEIAYQPPMKSYSANIAQILSIPRQTVSEEFKRLLNLHYLQPLISNETLMDGRFKYYGLTRKGITFLHLLKESLRVTLMRMHEDTVHQ
ncbi:MAG: right-handed parallel beta-helix repeat-containing protein [Candidatus Hodarchaeales archaeon]|jgi:parallel beta-helix repeat protein